MPWPHDAAARRQARLLRTALKEPSVPLSPLHVISTADSGAGSLREAIFFANAHPGSTIDFNVSGPITLAQSLPMITASVTINGGSGVTIDAAHTGRVFFV